MFGHFGTTTILKNSQILVSTCFDDQRWNSFETKISGFDDQRKLSNIISLSFDTTMPPESEAIIIYFQGFPAGM